MATLQAAVRQQDLGRVQALLDAKVNVNQLDEDGYTALYLAAKKEDTLRILQHLVAAGAKVDLKGDDDETPLYIAVFNGSMENAAVLLSHGAAANEINGPEKETALHCAARMDNVAGVRSLVDSGANINFRNARMETPLYVAAKNGRGEVVFELLRRGANKALANGEGKDALYIASEKNHQGVVRLLKAEKQFLSAIKGDVVQDERMRKPSLPSTDKIAVQKEREEERRKEAGIPAEEEERVVVETTPVEPIVVPKGPARTHDPFTGKKLPPCKTWVEAGDYDAPPVPEGAVKDIAEMADSYGGTAMLVGTGTDGPVRQRPLFSPESGDVFDNVTLPDKKKV